MGQHGNRILGTALVGIGLLMLLGELGLTALKWLWPSVLLVIGVAMLVHYHRHRDDSGKVFTGSLLVLLAFFFQLSQLDVIDPTRHWPFFVLAPGIALLVMARVDEVRRDAMVPGWIAIGVAAALYFFTLGVFTFLLGALIRLLGLVLTVLIPLGLIGLGAWMLFNQREDTGPGPELPEKVEPKPADEGAALDEDDEEGATADVPPFDRAVEEDEPDGEDPLESRHGRDDAPVRPPDDGISGDEVEDAEIEEVDSADETPSRSGDEPFEDQDDDTRRD